MEKVRVIQNLRNVEKVINPLLSILEDINNICRVKGVKYWPTWCYLPTNLVNAVLCKSEDPLCTQADLDTCDHYGRAVIATVVGAWKITKSVYRFNDDLFSALTKTTNENIPTEILFRLPEWSIYIDLEDKNLSYENRKLHGFYAYLNYDKETELAELLLLLDVGNGFTIIPLCMLMNNIAAMAKEGTKRIANKGIVDDYDTKVSNIPGGLTCINKLVNLTVYLCSENPDYKEGHAPGRPRKVRKKGKYVHKPARRPMIREVGYRLGRLIRAAQAAQECNAGRSVAPHIRKAHWHSWWTGPRDGERKLIVKWLPPKLINAEKEVPTTVIRNVSA